MINFDRKPEYLFSDEPTARADEVAEYVRAWYEKNRETWWDRHRFVWWRSSPDRAGVHSDEFMLRFVAVVDVVLKAARRDR